MQLPETDNSRPSNSLSTLRRFTGSRPKVVVRCELCSAEIPSDHPHLFDRTSRQIACSCEACAILFCGQNGAKFQRVPSRTVKLKNFTFSENEWDAMMLPIHLAFFLRDASNASTAFYPSPAGAMKSMLELPGWADLTRNHTTLASLEPDVEALLVNRIGDHHTYFIVPVDVGYRLVGLVRVMWRGLSGGPDVWRVIHEFLAELEGQATTVREVPHA